MRRPTGGPVAVEMRPRTPMEMLQGEEAEDANSGVKGCGSEGGGEADGAVAEGGEE